MNVPFQRGMTFGFYARRGVYSSEWARREILKMRRLGVDCVGLIVTVFRENDYSTREFLDFAESPGELETARLIDFIHAEGMKVMLRPMLESHDGNGRLQVNFAPDRERIPGKVSAAWSRWFDSFRARTRVMATLAAETGCEFYGLDSELDCTVSHRHEWKEVIKVARECFPGPITSCHTHNKFDFETELADPAHWFRDLDFLQTSFYRQGADAPGWTADQMVEKLIPERDRYRRIATLLGKPVMFGECGCTSSTGGAVSPSGWRGNGGYAPEEQANYLEAVCRLFWPEPWFRGLYWWKWDEENPRRQFSDDPAGDKGFILDGKPAADTLKHWYGTPPAGEKGA